MVSIQDLVAGERARLVGYGQTDVSLRQRLLALGLTCGIEIRVVRLAPLGCPVEIEVRGALLGLRKAEVSELQWERV